MKRRNTATDEDRKLENKKLCELKQKQKKESKNYIAQLFPPITPCTFHSVRELFVSCFSSFGSDHQLY